MPPKSLSKPGSLTLYRGISAKEFNLASEELIKGNRKTWRAVLENRLSGDLRYPNELDRSIQLLHKNLRLEYQYFTDSKSIAEGYARKVAGLLVELTVPLGDVIKHFDIEFQNFGRRKKQFEIVYRVKASTLRKHEISWQLKISRKK